MDKIKSSAVCLEAPAERAAKNRPMLIVADTAQCWYEWSADDVYQYGLLRCSNCKCELSIYHPDSLFSDLVPQINYCPDCGARIIGTRLLSDCGDVICVYPGGDND